AQEQGHAGALDRRQRGLERRAAERGLHALGVETDRGRRRIGRSDLAEELAQHGLTKSEIGHVDGAEPRLGDEVGGLHRDLRGGGAENRENPRAPPRRTGWGRSIEDLLFTHPPAAYPLRRRSLHRTETMI